MKVGITGHQERSGIDWDWVREAFENELRSRQIETAHASLAVGSDQLFATVVLQHGITLVGVLPFEDYERTFDEAQKEAYFRLLHACSEVITLNSPGDDQIAYLNAGKHVVMVSELMFAVWDGKKGETGGTADIVQFAKDQGKTVIHINPMTQKVVLL